MFPTFPIGNLPLPPEEANARGSQVQLFRPLTKLDGHR